MKHLIAAAVVLGMAGTAAYAQEQGNTAPDTNAPPAMMGRHGNSMTGNMDHAQMQRMMENCNRMMESRTQQPAPEKKS